ncbi:hypothetical protein C8R41DRAFT_747553, partial [Lentinula lateritia]
LPVPGRDKRFNIGDGTLKWKDVTELISRRNRSWPGDCLRIVHFLAQTSAPLDITFAKEVLGL